jgi:hypothetical protein
MPREYLHFDDEAAGRDQQVAALAYYAVFRKSVRRIAREPLKSLDFEKEMTSQAKALAGAYWAVTHCGICHPHGLRGPLAKFFEEEYAAFMAWQREMGYQFSSRQRNPDQPGDYRPAVERWLGDFRAEAPRSQWFAKKIQTVRYRRLLTDVKKALSTKPIASSEPVDDEPEDVGSAEAEPHPDSEGALSCLVLVMLAVGVFFLWRWLSG